jgi:hypothetical protein
VSASPMSPAAIRGAFDVLLRRCLQLHSTDELLVIFDESSLPYHSALIDAAARINLSVTHLMLPLSDQLRLIETGGPHPSLPSGILASISASTAVITLLQGEPDTTAVRKAVVLQPRPGACRLAHIPGLTADVLDVLGKSPIDDILRACELLAWVLGTADTVQLITYDHNGQDYTLCMKLNGWDNEPLMSPGVIFRGTWGNIPPGETFCCPPLADVNGLLCVNGSIPKLVLKAEQDILLHFNAGILTEWNALSCSPATSFFQAEKDRADKHKDDNWRCCAEFGIGLNPAISQLTGHELFDEKAERTVHVAIGDNSVFGHPIESQVHHDLVVREPTIRLDHGLTVMNKGILQVDAMRKWRDSLTWLEPWTTPPGRVTLREPRIRVSEDSVDRRLQKGLRIGYVRMVGPQLSRPLAACIEDLRDLGDIPVSEFIALHPSYSGVVTTRLLQILHHYSVLREH